MAHDVYDHLPVNLLLDDSKTTCFGVDGGSMADFTIKFSTTANYQSVTSEITILVGASIFFIVKNVDILLVHLPGCFNILLTNIQSTGRVFKVH